MHGIDLIKYGPKRDQKDAVGGILSINVQETRQQNGNTTRSRL